MVILIECILYIRSRRWERVKISSILIHPSTLALAFALTLTILYPKDDSENFRFNISSQAFIHTHACTNHHIVSFSPISHTSLVSFLSPIHVYLRELPPPISCPNLYPAILSHSIFCLVIGNCLLSPLKAPSLKLLNPLLISSWYLFSTTAIPRTILLADDNETAETGLVVRSRTFPSS